MDSYPADFFYGGKSSQKFCEHPLAVEVQTVVSSVLCNEDKFPHALGGKRSGLRLNILHRHGPVRSADERYGAIGAAPVTAFGNLDIGVGVVLFTRHPPGPQGRLHLSAESLDHRSEIPRAVPAVHLRYETGKLVGIALGKTAEDQKLLRQALLLSLDAGENLIDTLLLGLADEAACIDKQVIHRRLVILRLYVEAVFDLGQKMLGVNGVLRTA